MYRDEIISVLRHCAFFCQRIENSQTGRVVLHGSRWVLSEKRGILNGARSKAKSAKESEEPLHEHHTEHRYPHLRHRQQRSDTHRDQRRYGNHRGDQRRVDLHPYRHLRAALCRPGDQPVSRHRGCRKGDRNGWHPQGRDRRCDLRHHYTGQHRAVTGVPAPEEPGSHGTDLCL